MVHPIIPRPILEFLSNKVKPSTDLRKIDFDFYSIILELLFPICDRERFFCA